MLEVECPLGRPSPTREAEELNVSSIVRFIGDGLIRGVLDGEQDRDCDCERSVSCRLLDIFILGLEEAPELELDTEPNPCGALGSGGGGMSFELVRSAKEGVDRANWEAPCVIAVAAFGSCWWLGDIIEREVLCCGAAQKQVQCTVREVEEWKMQVTAT